MAEIKYTHKDHIITLQKQNEEAFLAEFAAGDYTLTNPLVKLNPYIICPLSAMILFKTPRAEEVTIIVHGKEAAGDIRHTFQLLTNTFFLYTVSMQTTTTKLKSCFKTVAVTP